MEDDTYSITEGEVSRQFAECLTDAVPPAISKMFGKIAHKTATHMAIHEEDNFDWIRKEPFGLIAYQTAVWQFLIDLSEKRTGTPYQLPKDEDEILDAVGHLSVAFSVITFGAYNKMTGGEALMPEPTDDPKFAERCEMDRKIEYFYGTFLAPQLRAFGNPL